MEVRFNKENHSYEDDDGPLVAVSTVTKKLHSFEGIDSGVLQNAANRGTAVHSLCELWDNGELDMSKVDPELLPYLEGWINFTEQTNFKVIQMEQIVADRNLRFAGRLDRTGSIGSSKYVLDIKTGTNPTPAWGVQIAAYKSCLEGGRLYNCVALQLKKDGSYRLHAYPDYQGDIACFRALLTLRNWKLNRGVE